jgi:translation initiation factor 1 (eIF-1/SUI1)
VHRETVEIDALLNGNTTMKIGVIAIQGDVEEHVIALEKTLAEREDKGAVVKAQQSAG